MPHSSPSGVRPTLLVAAGGAVGTAARLGLAELIGNDRPFPAATLLVNVAGTIALGVIVARTRRSARSSTVLLAFAAVGLLGSFTTFAAVAVVVAGGFDGAAYGLVSLAAGPLAAWLGLHVGGRR
ncbi:MAG: CrcB family protein [Acidimicrobiia bacterium]|nr:CrcB family protein [Acidimicrobiia bacterium]